MDSFPDVLIGIVCSFLKPTELVRARKLNKQFKKQIEIFLIRNRGTTIIQNFVCPCCGSWLDKDYNIDFDTSFQDLSCLEDELERMFFIEDFFLGKEYIRKKLLCDWCEIQDHEIYNDTDIFCMIGRFAYRGNREYKFYVGEDYRGVWSIVYTNSIDTIHWNEYRILSGSLMSLLAGGSNSRFFSDY